MGETHTVLLTITMTAAAGTDGVTYPGTDLGYLLHKHPGKVQAFDLPVGRAHVFYPEVSDERCTAALLLEVDPIALVRGKGRGAHQSFALAQYVNDRPYAASSMLAVAMAKVFNTAMTGRCNTRPELAAGPVPLEIVIPALACRGGAALAQRLFGPMGWAVQVRLIPADTEVRRWGDSRYVELRLTGDVRLADALHHLYVMLPVLDDAKHYWVGTDEVEKLIRAGAGWLGAHPERDLITSRYLAHRRELVATAVGRLAEIDDVDGDQLDNAVPLDQDGLESPAPQRLTTQVQYRHRAVLTALRDAGASSVVDIGCGEASLVAAMASDPSFRRILGVDVSARALQMAARRLRLDSMSDSRRERVQLMQSSLTYRDDRFAGFDAVVLMEVIEHVDPSRLEALQRNIFIYARPETVIVTTPNAEYNVRYPDLPAGTFRHHDHRFEWTRVQFEQWASDAAGAHGYIVRYLPVGPDDAEVGSPTSMAVFSRSAS